MSQATPRPQDLAEESIALARKWITEAASIPTDASAARLAGVLRDPNGLDFTVGFVDGVVRPEDLGVAAKKLKELVPLTPEFPARRRCAARSASAARSRKPMPGVVVPIARKVLRQMVSHLIIDASDSKLGPALAKIQRDGVRLNMNLLGEAILGQGEAERRLAGTHKLLARPRRRLRLDQGLLDGRAPQPLGVRRGNRRTSRASSSRSSSAPRPRRRRSSSTSTWRSTRISTSRSRSSPASSTAPSSWTSRPASCSRPTSPTPSVP